MKRLAHIDVYRIYNAVGRCIDDFHVGYNATKTYQYYCKDCDSYFTTNRKEVRNINYLGFNLGTVYCPNCGIKHTLTKGKESIYYLSHMDKDNLSAKVPLSATLDLWDLKNQVLLKIKYDTIYFSKNKVNKGTVVEELRFDIKERSTTFKTSNDSDNVLKLGNPLNRSFLNNSLITHLAYFNDSKAQIKEMQELLKKLRSTVQRKFKQLHHFNLGSIFVSHGTQFGRLAFPLFNIAYRLLFCDYKNLPIEFASDYTYNTFCTRYGITKDEYKKWGSIDVKSPYVSIRYSYSLPDKPWVRKYMSEDLFSCIGLSLVCKISDNPDYQQQIYKRVRKHATFNDKRTYEYTERNLREMLDNIAYAFPSIGFKGCIRLLENKNGWGYITDTLYMFKRLPAAYRPLAGKVKPKVLHDWLSKTLDKLRNTDYSLDVPEHIKNRLEMQNDRIKFFMPDTSYMLKDAGKELHNCVGTYAERCLKQEVNIVLMSDDKGKLVACLEIRSGALVQAKLKNNKQVKEDTAINAEIREWCEACSLNIETDDIDVTGEDEIKQDSA